MAAALRTSRSFLQSHSAIEQESPVSPMNRSLVPLGILACGLAMSAPAAAATRNTLHYDNPGSACQLSIPTTDTEVRPKATGFRNESTTKSAFVICGVGKPTLDGFSTKLEILFTSMDGGSRIVNCTAVTGLAGLWPLVYSSKSISSTASGSYSLITWTSSDFGGSTEIPGSYSLSVTCTLPPQTAITIIGNYYPIEIGS